MTKEINLDIILISLFTNKEYYSKYYSYINNYLVNNYKNNNKLLYKLYRCLQLQHGDSDNVSLEDIYTRLLREYPALPVDEKELAQETLQKAAGSTFDPEGVSALVQRQYEAAKASEVALMAIQVAEGKASIQDLSKIIEEDNLSVSEETNAFDNSDLAELQHSTVGATGLRWPLTTLNKALGSLRPGDFGFFFARPEVGKTTFLAHIVTSMVASSGAQALWFNNEEGGNKVKLRCYQSFLQVDTRSLFQDVPGNQAKYEAGIGDRLKFVHDPTINATEIERIVAKVRPALVVIDQLDKVLGFDAERHDLLMKAKYQWAREIAKKYQCAVIGVCQAGGTAENKKKLVMTDVDSSHTAKQGEADWIIGIGKVNDEGLENVRYFNIIKNKLVGDVDSIPDLRHGFFDVVIQPEIGIYKDRINWQ